MYLLEAINYSFYQDKLDQEMFDTLLEQDPTSDKKYARWIVENFIREFGTIYQQKKGMSDKHSSIRDQLTQADMLQDPLEKQRLTALYQQSMFQQANFYKTPEYQKLKRFLAEDIDKIKEDLKIYHFLKNKKKLPDERMYNILNIKGFSTLWQIINSIPDDIKAEADPLGKDEYEKWYEDKDWLVVIPKTHRASCKYGANTRWCTASKDNDHYFNQYSSDDTPLIIIIEKGGNKWQIHFDSNQWMDEQDEEIEDRSHFLRNILPATVKDAIYQRTRAFPFADKEQQVEEAKRIASTHLTIFSKKASYINPVHIFEGMNTSDRPDFDEFFDEKIIRWGLFDVLQDGYTDFSDDYSYGSSHPWEFLDTEPEDPDNLISDEAKNYRNWKQDIDLWSEEQKEEAGDKARDSAEEAHYDEYYREFIRSYGWSKEYSGDITNKVWDACCENLNTSNYSFNPEEVTTSVLRLLRNFSDLWLDWTKAI